jgi:hypothetical protein
MSLRPRPLIDARYGNFSVNIAFLLPVQLNQQPLKDAFRVGGQSHEAPHPELWLARI